jgi:hypothetical protein
MACMMSFSCEMCNYNTPHKANYERHLQSAKHLETKEDITCFSCDLCKYSTKEKSNYDRHLKSLKHFHKTRPTEQEIMHKMATLWCKYVSRKTPEEDERECVYKYFDRNWEEMVSDNELNSRPKVPYTSKEDFDKIWGAVKTVNSIVLCAPQEEQIDEM